MFKSSSLRWQTHYLRHFVKTVSFPRLFISYRKYLKKPNYKADTISGHKKGILRFGLSQLKSMLPS